MPLHLGRIGILLGISIAAFTLTTVAGMSTAQAPSPLLEPEIVTQLSTDTKGSQPDKTAVPKSDAAVTHRR